MITSVVPLVLLRLVRVGVTTIADLRVYKLLRICVYIYIKKERTYDITRNDERKIREERKGKRGVSKFDFDQGRLFRCCCCYCCFFRVTLYIYIYRYRFWRREYRVFHPFSRRLRASGDTPTTTFLSSLLSSFFSLCLSPSLSLSSLDDPPVSRAQVLRVHYISVRSREKIMLVGRKREG